MARIRVFSYLDGGRAILVELLNFESEKPTQAGFSKEGGFHKTLVASFRLSAQAGRKHQVWGD